MCDGIEMKVGKNSKRNGFEIQGIVDNFFFVDPNQGFLEFMHENWFIDFLEDIVNITKRYSNEFKIYIFDISIKDSDSYFLIAFVFCKDNDSNFNDFDSLKFDLSLLKSGIDLIESYFMVIAIEDEEYFKRVYDGELLND